MAWGSYQERFNRKVDKNGPNGCWSWIGAKDKHGRGYMRYSRGRDACGDHKQTLAYRICWELCFGKPIPDGFCVCHKCDNPNCVNPDHLFLGTQLDNVRDMHTKGRAKYKVHRGEKHGMAILSEKDVADIKMLREWGLMHKDLAVMFGVCKSQIGNVLNGVSWTKPSSVEVVGVGHG